MAFKEKMTVPSLVCCVGDYPGKKELDPKLRLMVTWSKSQSQKKKQPPLDSKIIDGEIICIANKLRQCLVCFCLSIQTKLLLRPQLSKYYHQTPGYSGQNLKSHS